jgi:hypothetical protein
MAVTTCSVFTQFVLSEYNFIAPPSNLAAIGLTWENWPATGSGYPALAARQLGGSNFGAGSPLAWMPGVGGAEGDPYFREIQQNDAPVLYQQLTAAKLGTSPAIFGLSSKGSLVLVATQDASGSWAAGQVLPVNPAVATCTEFIVIPGAAGNTAQVIGLSTGGVPVVASVFDGSSWAAGPNNGTPGGLQINAASATYSSLTSATWGGSFLDPVSYLFGIASGTPYIISIYNGTAWTAGAANGEEGLSSLRFYSPSSGPAVQYTAVVAIYQRMFSRIYLLGLGTDQQLYVITWLTTLGNWIAGFSLAPRVPGVTFSSFVAASEAMLGSSKPYQTVIFALSEAGAAYMLPLDNGNDGSWLTTFYPAQTIYEYGQPVVFTQLRAAYGSDGVLRCVGLGGASGQLYEVFTWTRRWLGGGLPMEAGVAGPGQGRLPGLFSQNAYSAQVFAAALLLDLDLLCGFCGAFSSDVGGWNGTAPFAMSGTASFLRPQEDPLSNIALPSTPPDVLRALTVAAAGNVVLWAGVYDSLQAGEGWPATSATQPVTVTLDGSVYYGSYNLSALSWTFSGGVLSWDAPTAAQQAAGAPPVAGALTFVTYLPSAPGPGGYAGPGFTGTLSGTIGGIAATAPQPNPLPSLESFTVVAGTLGVGQTTTATLVLADDAPYPGAAVTIVCQSPFLITPQCVVVPAGESSTTFTVGPWNFPFPSTGTLTINLQALVGNSVLSASVVAGNMKADPAGVEGAASFSASFSASPVVGGGSSQLVLTLPSALTTPTSFTVVSGNEAVAWPSPADTRFEILPGVTSLSINVATTVVNTQETVTFYVLNMSVTPRGQLTPVLSVGPRTASDVEVTSLHLSPAAVLGRDEVVATLNLSSVAPAELTITTTSSSSAVAWPAGVTVPVGAATQSFALTTSSVAAKTQVLLTAANAASTATAARASLTVGPLPSLAGIGISPASMRDTETGGVDATLSEAPVRPVTLTLTSRTPSVISVSSEASVVVTAPAQVAGWELAIHPPDAGSVSVTLTVSGAASPTSIAGWSPSSVAVLVYPNGTGAVSIGNWAIGGAGLLATIIGTVTGYIVGRNTSAGSAAVDAAAIENTANRAVLDHANLQAQGLAPTASANEAAATQPPLPDAFAF